MKHIIKHAMKLIGVLSVYYYIRNNIEKRQKSRKKTARFKQEYNKLKLLWAADQEKRFSKFEILPILDENTSNISFDTHYIYHTSWAARVLQKTKPDIHTDISSALYFSSICSAFVPTQFFDYRPAHLFLSNLKSTSADLCHLPFANNSIHSLSCMHTIEHIGLGRYGDALDYNGDIKAMNELNRVLAVNGNLLFVVPIGKPKIVFNAHRIYGYEQIINYFPDLHLHNFMLIPDTAGETGTIENPPVELCNQQNYGCGCFWFIKKEGVVNFVPS